jgi:hypothetical protein
MLVRQVFSLQPATYRLSPDAYKAFREFQSWYHKAKQDERILMSHDTFMTAFGKIEGTTGRLILIYHLIVSPYSLEVSKDTVDKVVKIVKSYVIPALRYAFGEVAGLMDDSIDTWVTHHIIHISGETQHITLSSIKRSARRKLEHLQEWQRDAAITDAMVVLEHNGWVTIVDDSKRSTTWAINPSIAEAFKEYRVKVIKAKQRQKDQIIDCANATGRHTARSYVPGYDPTTMDD